MNERAGPEDESVGLPIGTDGAVVTVGTFDGMHRGHQDVLARLVARAAEIGLPSVVVTFDPHPLEIVNPAAAPLLLTLHEELKPRAPIVFHSAMTSSLPPQLDPALSDAEAGGAPPMVPPETPPLDTFRTLARELSAAVGVTLFGFDVVVERGSGALGVVDLNFFPSFRGCENIQRDMLAFLLARMGGAAVKQAV